MLWAAYTKQDTLTAVYWKVIMCHPFAAIIILCIMVLLVLFWLSDRVQIWVKTHVYFLSVTKPVVSQKVLIVKMNYH